MAVTINNTSILFPDGSSQITAADRSISLLASFGSITVGAKKGYIGLPVNSYYLWYSYDNGVSVRGVYKSSLSYIAGSGKSSYFVYLSGSGFDMVNVSASTMNLTLTMNTSVGTDDSRDVYATKDGTIISNSQGQPGTRTLNVSVAPNTTSNFKPWGTVGGGSGADAIYLTDFYLTFISWT